jgi:hypothetical protein
MPSPPPYSSTTNLSSAPTINLFLLLPRDDKKKTIVMKGSGR